MQNTIHLFFGPFQLELQVLSEKRDKIFTECLEKLVSVVDAFAFALGIEKNSIFDIKVRWFTDTLQLL